MKINNTLSAIFISIAVSACGGGGGSGGGGVTDNTPPTVSSTTPAGNATNVPLNTSIAALFSEPLNSTTVSASTFTLTYGSSVPVTGTLNYSGTTATFTPAANLTASTPYTATITTGVKDVAGNALASNRTWTFTTGVSTDATPPSVSSTSPANNAKGVAPNTTIIATFSEPLLASSVTADTFTIMITGSGTAITGAVSYSGTTATFTPTSALSYSTSYTATINAGTKKDLAGNLLTTSYTWTFTTGAAPDTTAPTVSSTSPANNDPSVATNAAISATFSEPLSAATVGLSTFKLANSATGVQVAGAITYSGTTATFTPSSALATSTAYTATVTTGVKDAAGNALAANYTWSFTTGNGLDTTPPTVSTTTPVDLAINVTAQNPVTANFSEAMDAATVSTATYTMFETSQGSILGNVPGTVTYSGTTATFTPSVKLKYFINYTATIATGVKDAAGNALAAPKTWSFTTRDAPVVNAVAAGLFHTVALKDDGTLWSWGSNQSGQLGDGTIVDRPTPAQIGTAADWAVMTAGDYHTLALKSDGTLWAWGDNQVGQLGDGTAGISANKLVPIKIGTATTWKAIAGGQSHTLGLQTDGTLWAWGSNFYGQLGDGTTVNKSAPTQIPSPVGTTWTAIAAGANHSLAILSDGTLWAWGYNFFGQLGDNTQIDKLVPTQVGVATGWGVVGAGSNYSLAIAGGALWAWGENAFGQLGDGTRIDKNAPIQIGTATTWQKIDGGYAHTLAIQSDRTLWKWGWNLDGAGNVLAGTYQLAPVKVNADTNWSSLSAGDAHSVALKTNWVLNAWGNNASGQLGDGTTTDQLAPLTISY